MNSRGQFGEGENGRWWRRWSPSGGLVAGALILLATTPSAGQIWSEERDAGSFPDKLAQRTRDPYHLLGVAGVTDEAAGDLRDGYCLRIADPASFRATTDPAVDPAAGADFDTRLFLFTPRGVPVLANDDSAGGASALSTLTGVATDGSGFVLERPGEYVLVVAGASDTALDRGLTELFALASDPTGVHAPQPSAGSFHHWSGGMPQDGTYVVALRGGETCGTVDLILGDTHGESVCLGKPAGGVNYCEPIHPHGRHTYDIAMADIDEDGFLDLFLSEGGFLDYCLGDGKAGFGPCTHVTPANVFGRGLDAGDLNGDGHVDAVFTLTDDDQDLVCLGDGQANFACSDLDTLQEFTYDVALGYIDGDRHLDAVLAVGSNSTPDQVCLGDGSGSLQCEDLHGVMIPTHDVDLGDFDNDGDIDVILAYFTRPNRYCRGNGVGGFSQCVDVGRDVATEAIAVGDLNNDGELDLATTDGDVCLGDGAGGFTCSVELLPHRFDVVLGDLNSDGNLDVVQVDFNGPASYFPGDGTGTFGPRTDVGDGEIPLLRSAATGVVDVNYTFEDGFESGDTSGWSVVVTD